MIEEHNTRIIQEFQVVKLINEAVPLVCLYVGFLGRVVSRNRIPFTIFIFLRSEVCLNTVWEKSIHAQEILNMSMR